MPKAAGLADAIKDAFDVEAELIPGGGGIFDVRVNGKLIFSKKQVGRFPGHEEILSQLDKSA